MRSSPIGSGIRTGVDIEFVLADLINNLEAAANCFFNLIEYALLIILKEVPFAFVPPRDAKGDIDLKELISACLMILNPVQPVCIGGMQLCN